MANVAVKKASEQNQNANEQQSLTRQTGGEVAGRGFWDPLSSWTPSEFFSSNPFSLMRRFTEEMDRTFGRFFKGQGEESFWSPAIEVTQNEGQLKVHAELAGLKPEDVHVEVMNDQLILRGERKYEHEEKNKGVYRSERRYGQFYRSIPLPEGAATEQAKAQFNNGVLEITMPAPEQKGSRREIPIESS
jgi:HSP20 family protein